MQARWVLFVGALALAAPMAVTGGALAPAVVRPESANHPGSVQSARTGTALAFLSHLDLGIPPIPIPPRDQALHGIQALSSTNWAGYAGLGAPSSFTSVSGSWVEPTATCGKGTSLAAFWVGLDGLSSSDLTVEQDGTLIECMDGTPTYYDWWETYPGNSVQLQNMIAPGDLISAQVTYNGSYSMTVTDSSDQSSSFTVDAPCGATQCENESAEWIAEAPCCKSGSTVYSLSNFGQWKATKSEVTYNGVTGTIDISPKVYEISMIDSSKAVKAQPSALKLGGASFRVKWVKGN